MMARIPRRFVVPGLINCGPLSNAVVMALPDNIRIRWESKQAFNRLSKWIDSSLERFPPDFSSGEEARQLTES